MNKLKRKVWGRRQAVERQRRLAGRALAVEFLEERAMFVVGSLALPTAIDEYTGVVRLGGTDPANTSPACSATLLESGRHLLTAGHCIVQNETQGINLIGVTDGQFRLVYSGFTTGFLPFDASAATVESALEGLPNIDNVNVTPGPTDSDPSTQDYTWTVEFRGALAVTNVPQMTLFSDPSDPLVGGTPSLATTRNGSAFAGAARFDLPSGTYVLTPGASSFTVHPNWRGLYFNADGTTPAGDDIAIIELPVIAPLGAERYDVYDDQDEVGQSLTIVGYGRGGVGETGEDAGPPDTANIKRSGQNEFGAVHAGSGALQADFDDGSEELDSLGDGLGLALLEAGLARGDSGGPDFIGDKIAGVNSAVDAAGLAGFSAFGDNGYFTRVSNYTENRDPLFDIETIINAPDDVVLDMNFQDAGNDSLDDVVQVRRIGPNKNTVQITINGEEVWRALRSRVLSLTIQGSTDDETFLVLDNLGLPVQISAGPGNDILFGGAGPETLNGGEGDDVIGGAGGLDSIDGGPGIDLFQETVGGTVLFTNSLLKQNGVIEFVTGFEGVHLTGSAGPDQITVDNFNFPAVIYGRGGSDWLVGHGGDDRLYGEAGSDKLEGGTGDDELYGGSQNDQLFGGGGRDLLWGGFGNDLLVGNGDPDELHGEDGADRLFGGANNTLLPDASGDRLFGGAGDDVIFGDSAEHFLKQQLDGGGDEIDAGPGNDYVFGQGGRDSIAGGSGNDVLSGGAGEDLLIGGAALVAGVLTGPDGPDTISGGEGGDTIYGDNVSETFGLEVGGGAGDQLDGDAGDDVILGGVGADTIHGGAGHDHLQGGEGGDTIQGDVGLDSLFGDPGNDALYGGADDDEVHGGLGDDQLAGQGGNDKLYGEEGHDVVSGGFFSNTPDIVPDAGADLIDGGDGNDRLMGDSGAVSGPFFAKLVGGDDTILGGAGADLMFGLVGRDKLSGGSDDDLLVGGAGSDELYGNDGDDVLNGEADGDLLVGGLGADTLGGGDGHDRLAGGSTAGPDDESADSLDGGAGDDVLLGDNGSFDPLVVPALFGGADILQGGVGNDVIYGQAGADFIGGGAGDDAIYAGAGADIVNGDSGVDSILGGSGDDVIAGGTGNDHLQGEQGDDLLIGGFFSNTAIVTGDASLDQLDGGAGNDRLYGDSFATGAPFTYGVTGGADTLWGGEGDDFLAGQSGDDVIEAGDGDDIVEAWAGADFVRGGEGDDRLVGGAGDDILAGEGGTDSLDGGAGRDFLVGGRDADRITGGSGDDLLISGLAEFAVDPALFRAIHEALASEWRSFRSYEARTANLRGTPNPTFNARLNGDFFLIKNATVVDDDATDVVFGESGRDWLLFDETLDVDDLAANEAAS